MITIFKLNPNETFLKEFDQTRIVAMCPFKKYKSITINQMIDDGRYAIIPTTLNMGETGRYILNIYHNCGDTGFKIIGRSGLTGQPIPEEQDEEIFKFSDEFKTILKVKASEVIYSDAKIR